MILATGVPLNVVATVAGAAAALVGALIVLNLRSIKQCLSNFGERLDKQDKLIEKNRDEAKLISDKMAACKLDCDRKTVSKEDWVRSEAYTRQVLEKQNKTLSLIEGKLDVVRQLPEIIGNIVKQVVSTLKEKG